jgi:hypothetical protein
MGWHGLLMMMMMEAYGCWQISYKRKRFLVCLFKKNRRDLIAMLSLVEPKGIQANAELYHNLLRILPAQIVTIDKSFLEVRKLQYKSLSIFAVVTCRLS